MSPGATAPLLSQRTERRRLIGYGVRYLALREPGGIGRMYCELAIVIWRAVIPPNITAFSQRSLGGIDL